MRLLTTLLLVTGFAGVSLAHEIGAGHSEFQQLAHQWFSLHHLPALVLILVAGAWLVSALRHGRRTK